MNVTLTEQWMRFNIQKLYNQNILKQKYLLYIEYIS